MRLDPSGRLVTGSVNAYEVDENGEWQPRSLEFPVRDLIWGEDRGYAVGADGIYTLDQHLRMALIDSSAGSVALLGELNESLLALDRDERLQLFESNSSQWRRFTYDVSVSGDLLGSVSLGNRLVFATSDGLYEAASDNVLHTRLAPGW